MNLFKWIGRKKREEAWMREPRRVPSFVASLPEDSERWQMSQEFVNDEDKNLRIYMAAWQPDPGREYWEVHQIEYNLKSGDTHVSLSWSIADLTDPMEVVKALRTFDKTYKKNEAYIMHPQERATYRGFANKYGIHFDDDGNVFRVETAAPLAKGTFMNREALDQLFHKAAEKTVPLDNWAGIYEGIVNKPTPELTKTVESFGLPAAPVEGAASVETAVRQYDAADWAPPAPSASTLAEVVQNIKDGHNVIGWKGGAATVPTAKEINEAMLQDNAAAQAPNANAPGEPAAPKEEPPPPVTINGMTLPELAKARPYAGYTPMQKLSIKMPLTGADLADDPAYAEYAHEMKDLVERLKELPALMKGAGSRYDKEATIRVVAKHRVKASFGSVEKQALAKRICDSSILVGLLRAGTEFYAEQFGPGKKFTTDGLQILSAIGNASVNFAVANLGVEAEAGRKIADVVSRGNDPSADGLPLEKLFAEHAPPKYAPPPPPAEPDYGYYGGSYKPPKKSSGGKKPPAKRSHRW